MCVCDSKLKRISARTDGRYFPTTTSIVIVIICTGRRTCLQLPPPWSPMNLMMKKSATIISPGQWAKRKVCVAFYPPGSGNKASCSGGEYTHICDVTDQCGGVPSADGTFSLHIPGCSDLPVDLENVSADYVYICLCNMIPV